jgi:hypothetical protein
MCMRCPRPAITRGHCDKHYRYLLNTGRFATFTKVDATEAREHLLKLRELGWTVMAMESASGVSMGQVSAIARGHYRMVRGDTARKILAVPLVPMTNHRGIDPTGTMRRIQALAWMGWPAREIAARAGTKRNTIHTLACRGGGRGRVSSDLARRIAAVFDELSGTPGPEPSASAHARRLGYAPPLAWDEDTIDDPAAEPQGLRSISSRRTYASTAEEYTHFKSLGMSDHAIARALGLRPDSLSQALLRARRNAA